MGSAVDDRNLRGNKNDVINAFKTCRNTISWQGTYNLKKAAMTSTCPKERKKLATTNLGTDQDPIYPRIFKLEILFGDMISIHKRNSAAHMDKRARLSRETSKRAVNCPTRQSLKARAIATKAIPQLLQGTPWAFPSSRSMKRLRTSILSGIWSTRRAMRCGEIVTAVLNDPTKLDPWAACIAKVILNVRRMLMKSKKRLLQFIETVQQAKNENDKDKNIQGPAFPFYRYTKIIAIDIDLDCKASNGNYAAIWLSDEHGECVNLKRPNCRHERQTPHVVAQGHDPHGCRTMPDRGTNR